MRFLRLQLRPFGAFEHLDLDFSETGGGAGLHLVYGPNGAGKSTTLDALRSALFKLTSSGDEARNFRYKSAALRIGAHIVRSNGDELRFVRRTSRTAPLWNWDDDEAVDIERLAPFLGNLDRERFETLFGLDLETMVRGGKDLLKGEGDIGRALFGAGLGGQQLGAAFESLEKRERSLWAGRASKARITAAITEHRDLKARLRQAIKTASSYQSERRELARLNKEAAADQELRRGTRRQIEELERLARAATVLGALETKRGERAQLGSAPALPKDEADRARALEAERSQLARDREAREARLRGAGAERIELEARADETVLAAAGELDTLSGRRGSFLEAAGALEAAERELEAATSARDEAAARAGDGTALGAGAELDPERGVDDRLDALDRHLERLQRTEQERSLRLKEHKRAEAAARRSGESLAAFDAEACASFALELEELQPFEGTLAELGAVSPPSAETVAEHGARWDALERAREEAERAREAIDADERTSREALARLDADPAATPPTADEVRAARLQRDALVREALDRAIAGEPTERDAALTVERAIALADALVDRRAAQSQRAIEREASLAALERLAHQRAELAREIESAAVARAAAADAFGELWNDEALRGLSPSSAQSWLDRRRALLSRVRERRDVARSEAASSRASQDERSADLEAAREEEVAARAAFEAWATAHGLDPDAGPDAARKRLRAQADVRAAQRDVERATAALERHRATIAEFTRDVAGLSSRLKVHVGASEGADALTAEAQAHALTMARMSAVTERADSATRAETELSRLEQEVAKEQEAGRAAASRSATIEDALRELVSSAGLASTSELLERAEVAGRTLAIEADIAELEASLRDAAGASSAEELRGAIGARTLGDLEAEAQQKREAIEELEAASRKRSERIGELRPQVEGAGDSDAVGLESRVAEVEAQLAEDTESYLQARIARALLEREVDRYRQETQGPLLERAQALFQTLTLGAYERLHPSERKGSAVMVARRPDGSTVHVEGMSTGTRDQLYLALRIASVEHMLRTVEPMPFIADDLFVNFDDERTEAALQVLAELSRSTQVIVFTHHLAVVETARRLTEKGTPVHVLELAAEAARESSR